MREKHCSRLEIYDHLRTSEQTDLFNVINIYSFFIYDGSNMKVCSSTVLELHVLDGGSISPCLVREIWILGLL